MARGCACPRLRRKPRSDRLHGHAHRGGAGGRRSRPRPVLHRRTTPLRQRSRDRRCRGPRPGLAPALLGPPTTSSSSPAIADLDNAPSGGMAGAITAAPCSCAASIGEGDRFCHFDIYGWNAQRRAGPPEGWCRHGRSAPFRGASGGAGNWMDPRETPSNGRVAHVSLRGQGRGGTFRRGHDPRRVGWPPYATLWRSPGGAKDREVLFGEAFRVLETRQRVSPTASPNATGMVGYLEAHTLTDLPTEPTHRVAVRVEPTVSRNPT